MNKSLKILLCLAVSAICLYWATSGIDWPKLKELLVGANFTPIIIGSLLSLVTFWLRAFRWQFLLNSIQKIPTFSLMRWQIGGLLINNLVPLRLGELARAYWAGHKCSISKSATFATIFVERVLDVSMVAIIGFILLTLSGLIEFNRSSMIYFILFGGLIGFGIFFVRYLIKSPDGSWFNKIKSKTPDKIKELIQSFKTGFNVFKNKKDLFAVLLLSPLIWAIDITIITILSRSLELNLAWGEGGITIVGLILGLMLPAAPGAAGTYEAGGVAALTLLGYPKTLSLSFIFLVHISQFVFILILGLPVLLFEGINLKSVREEYSQ